jgi:GH24 family phage-related lysozyme (muramidase)
MIKFMDGFNDDGLTDEVVAWERYLGTLGYPVEITGVFGSNLHTATRKFQFDQLVTADGKVGPITMARMTIALGVQSYLSRFRGYLGWIHQWEGHNGRPYWPGGRSGITLDPGVDLGYADLDMVIPAYQSLLTPPMIDDIHAVAGLKGQNAKKAMDNAGTTMPYLEEFTITREQADERFPVVAQSYWDAITDRFTTLRDIDTPGAVQVALLSIAYNRGANNKGLDILKKSMYNMEWEVVAQKIAGMQQTHKLQGIRDRRKAEGQLIIDHQYVG